MGMLGLALRGDGGASFDFFDKFLNGGLAAAERDVMLGAPT